MTWANTSEYTPMLAPISTPWLLTYLFSVTVTGERKIPKLNLRRPRSTSNLAVAVEVGNSAGEFQFRWNSGRRSEQQHHHLGRLFGCWIGWPVRERVPRVKWTAKVRKCGWERFGGAHINRENFGDFNHQPSDKYEMISDEEMNGEWLRWKIDDCCIVLDLGIMLGCQKNWTERKVKCQNGACRCFYLFIIYFTDFWKL